MPNLQHPITGMVIGSRRFNNRPLLIACCNEYLAGISLFVSGGCQGPDKWGEEWARANGVNCSIFPAAWNEFGRSAGYRRSADMVKAIEIRGGAVRVLAFVDGNSAGTWFTVQLCEKAGFEVRVYDWHGLRQSFNTKTE